MRWISALAPTSTPRVGSSRKMTFGLTDEHLGDGDLLLIAARQGRDRLADMAVFEIEPRAQPLGLLGLAALVDDGRCRGDLLDAQRRDIGGDRHVEEQAVALAVLRQVDDALRDAVGIVRQLQRRGRAASTSPVTSPSSRQMPLTISLRPAPIRPARPRISPLRSWKETSRKPLALGQVAHLEDDLVRTARPPPASADRGCR